MANMVDMTWYDYTPMGEEHPINMPGSSTIGSDPSCDVVVNGKGVCEVHCCIHVFSDDDESGKRCVNTMLFDLSECGTWHLACQSGLRQFYRGQMNGIENGDIILLSQPGSADEDIAFQLVVNCNETTAKLVRCKKGKSLSSESEQNEHGRSAEMGNDSKLYESERKRRYPMDSNDCPDQTEKRSRPLNDDCVQRCEWKKDPEVSKKNENHAYTSRVMCPLESPALSDITEILTKSEWDCSSVINREKMQHGIDVAAEGIDVCSHEQNEMSLEEPGSDSIPSRECRECEKSIPVITASLHEGICEGPSQDMEDGDQTLALKTVNYREEQRGDELKKHRVARDIKVCLRLKTNERKSGEAVSPLRNETVTEKGTINSDSGCKDDLHRNIEDMNCRNYSQKDCIGTESSNTSSNPMFGESQDTSPYSLSSVCESQMVGESFEKVDTSEDIAMSSHSPAGAESTNGVRNEEPVTTSSDSKQASTRDAFTMDLTSSTNEHASESKDEARALNNEESENTAEVESSKSQECTGLEREESRQRCTYCARMFTISELFSHIEKCAVDSSIVSTDEDGSCPYCGESFGLMAIVSHVECCSKEFPTTPDSDIEQDHPCHKCESLVTMSERDSHECSPWGRDTKDDEDDIEYCPNCDNEFKVEELVGHIDFCDTLYGDGEELGDAPHPSSLDPSGGDDSISGPIASLGTRIRPTLVDTIDPKWHGNENIDEVRTSTSHSKGEEEKKYDLDKVPISAAYAGSALADSTSPMTTSNLGIPSEDDVHSNLDDTELCPKCCREFPLADLIEHVPSCLHSPSDANGVVNRTSECPVCTIRLPGRMMPSHFTRCEKKHSKSDKHNTSKNDSDMFPVSSSGPGKSDTEPRSKKSKPGNAEYSSTKVDVEKKDHSKSDETSTSRNDTRMFPGSSSGPGKSDTEHHSNTEHHFKSDKTRSLRSSSRLLNRRSSEPEKSSTESHTRKNKPLNAEYSSAKVSGKKRSRAVERSKVDNVSALHEHDLLKKVKRTKGFMKDVSALSSRDSHDPSTASAIRSSEKPIKEKGSKELRSAKTCDKSTTIDETSRNEAITMNRDVEDASTATPVKTVPSVSSYQECEEHCTYCLEMFTIGQLVDHVTSCSQKASSSQSSLQTDELEQCCFCLQSFPLSVLIEHAQKCEKRHECSSQNATQLQSHDPLERCMYCFRDFPIAELVAHGQKCDGDMSGPRDRFCGFLPSVHDLSAISSVATLTDRQHAALQYVIERSAQASNKVADKLTKRVRRLGYRDGDLQKTLYWIRSASPIIIHVNLDRVLQHLVTDSHYRNRFETGISGGSLDKRMRKQWEDRIFNNIYHDSPRAERVKYGVLNIVGDPNGVKTCLPYGDSFLQLKMVRLRTTFASMDTSGSQVQLSCCEHYGNVLHEYTDQELKAIMDVATRRVLYHHSDCISHYKEVQIHGPVSLSENVECIVVNSRHKHDSHVIRLLDEFIQRNKCNLIWMDQ